MNDRIRELMIQAMIETGRLENVQATYQRFAELIVRECAKSANDWYQNHDKVHSDPMSYVLAHFGVEE